MIQEAVRFLLRAMAVSQLEVISLRTLLLLESYSAKVGVRSELQRSKTRQVSTSTSSATASANRVL